MTPPDLGPRSDGKPCGMFSSNPAEACTSLLNLMEARAESDRLREALLEARRRLLRFDDKGPKQVGRALHGIDRALGIERGHADAPR